MRSRQISLRRGKSRVRLLERFDPKWPSRVYNNQRAAEFLAQISALKMVATPRVIIRIKKEKFAPIF